MDDLTGKGTGRYRINLANATGRIWVVKYIEIHCKVCLNLKFFIINV